MNFLLLAIILEKNLVDNVIGGRFFFNVDLYKDLFVYNLSNCDDCIPQKCCL